MKIFGKKVYRDIRCLVFCRTWVDRFFKDQHWSTEA